MPFAPLILIVARIRSHATDIKHSEDMFRFSNGGSDVLINRKSWRAEARSYHQSVNRNYKNTICRITLQSKCIIHL